MKKRNLEFVKWLSFPGIIVIGLAALLFSCKKDNTAAVSQRNDMVRAAGILGGELLSGPLSIQNSDDGLAFSFNKGKQFIYVARIPGSPIATIGNMKSAQVIISTHGIILKDATDNKTYFLINNDPESVRKFEMARSYFTGNSRSDLIYGTTVVNGENS